MNAPMMSYEELAELLSVKLATLRTWVHRGVGPPPVRLGPRTTRFRRADVEAWIASNVYEPEEGLSPSPDDSGDAREGEAASGADGTPPPVPGCE